MAPERSAGLFAQYCLHDKERILKYTSSTRAFDSADRAAGILMVNLGTPEAPSASALRAYLREFLSDPRVVEQPRWLWWPILHGVILNIRPARSARAYQRIWTEQGSPLLTISMSQGEKLAALLGDQAHVQVAMRYGSPSVAHGLRALREKGCRRIVVLPLYPQYSATTVGSTFDAVGEELRAWRHVPELTLITDYYDHPQYIEALAQSIEQHWQQHGRAERLLCSFHGIPERYARAGDPYPQQCERTTRLLRQRLGLDEDALSMSYQSRFGREPWLQPYTDHTLEQWAGAGVRSVDVICPGFAADCLETLEEMAMENRDVFLQAGGREYRYIPALNDSDSHMQALQAIVQEFL